MTAEIEEMREHVDFRAQPVANRPDWIRVTVTGSDGAVQSADIHCSSGEIRNLKVPALE